MTDNQSNRPWFLVQFKPNSHHIAKRNLERQGFEAFLPMKEYTSRKNGRFVKERKPLFPGYMFISFDIDDAPWRKIKSTMGVARLVSLGDGPTQVPTGLVKEMLTNCDEDGTLKPPNSLGPGDRIKVTDGPFSDFIATIEQITGEQRVWVLLDFMGRRTRVTVDTNQVSKIN